MSARAPGPVESLLSALDDAVGMLGEYSVNTELAVGSDNPGSLLDQCLELCADRAAQGPAPVRTLHHFACSGGSLISKCVAVMPNTRLLSEVDPLSTMLDGEGGRRQRFSPTDMINLARQGSRGIDDALVIAMFLADLELLHADSARRGQRLVLRDHAHGHFVLGPRIPPRPTLRDIVRNRFPVLSALTVRHPLDSWLSLRKNGWVNFAPATLDEYARRYHAFLDAHAGVPVLRYEDFLAAPEARMRELCGHLELPYNAEFAGIFDAIEVTGDSGRSGPVIEARTRRPTDPATDAESAASPHYRRLLQRLSYDE